MDSQTVPVPSLWAYLALLNNFHNHETQLKLEPSHREPSFRYPEILRYSLPWPHVATTNNLPRSGVSQVHFHFHFHFHFLAFSLPTFSYSQPATHNAEDCTKFSSLLYFPFRSVLSHVVYLTARILRFLRSVLWMARWLVGRLAGGFLTQFSGVSVAGGIYIGGVRSDRIGSEGQSAITALSSVTQTLLLEHSTPSKSTAQCNKCIAKQI